ncbi:MAG: ChbG/HpnK family deacetylase [Acidobacteriaceae bacterium]
MPARLILNADDFGLTNGINRAVAELHQAGVLTSATLMANGPAFQDAVRIALDHPSLGVGCHIVLTDGVPVSPPEAIPTLLSADGRTFRPKLTQFIRDLLLGRIRESEIQCEALAQVRKIQHSGIRITHLDTHKHTHVFPPVTRALLQVMQVTSVAALRNPFEPDHTRAYARLKRRLQISLLNEFQNGFHRIIPPSLTTNGTFGISATGSLNAEELSELFRHIPGQGTFELLCHPGYNDQDLDAIPTRLREHRQTERRALLREVPAMLLHPQSPQLIHYGDAFGDPKVNAPGKPCKPAPMEPGNVD